MLIEYTIQDPIHLQIWLWLHSFIQNTHQFLFLSFISKISMRTDEMLNIYNTMMRNRLYFEPTDFEPSVIGNNDINYIKFVLIWKICKNILLVYWKSQ